MTTANATRAAQPTPKRSRRTLYRALTLIGVAVALLVGVMFVRMNYVPADLDYSTTLLSEQGLYQLSYTSDLGAVPINQMQSWTLHVTTPAGQPVENATITVDGDMPQHGHGLPTRPEVTQYLGNGDYKVEGLKFHMGGWWVTDFVVTADGQTDQVRFNLLLQ